MRAKKNIEEPLKYKDVHVFIGLYEEYAPALYGQILTLTPDRTMAATILEGSFVKIWRQINYGVVAGRSVFPMMLCITIKECSELLGVSNVILLKRLLHTGRRHVSLPYGLLPADEKSMILN